MAKLNWQKLADWTKRYEAREDARDIAKIRQEKDDLLKANIWSIGKKHYGKKLTDLPTQYLCWYTEAQEEANKTKTLAYNKAAQELRHRYTNNT